ncbi:MAG: P1 family peptidase [Coriobacteriales bacterium]|nr:P1 family peptidase [Coriobacteriales bacterium]
MSVTPALLSTQNIQTGSDAILPEGFLLGHAQDESAGTGCTAIICEQGGIAGVSVRGAAPATRETDLLDPCNVVERAHAVVLSGGSAFGLDAANGVMRWLEQRGVGFPVNDAVVPIVCSACIFDLNIGDGSVRPDAAFGLAACEDAMRTGGRVLRTGNVGVGAGASVGKLLDIGFAMKGGFGAASIQLGEIRVAALVAVNAFGNVLDRTTGELLAGVRDPQAGTSILDSWHAFSLMLAATEQTTSGAETAHVPGFAATPVPGANTTIGCVLTNATLTKAHATRVADMAHDGLARAIDPVHTSFDGDALFALSTAKLAAPPDLIGALGAAVTEAAILNAIRSATSAHGLPSAQDLTKHDAWEGA